MQNNILCKFDLDIYDDDIYVHYRRQTALRLSFRTVKQHADISSNAWDMAFYVEMTFTQGVYKYASIL